MGNWKTMIRRRSWVPRGRYTHYTDWKEPMPLEELEPRGRYSPTGPSHSHCEARVKPRPSSSSDHGQPPAGLLKGAGVSAPDWRYVLGDVKNISAVRKYLAHELTERPPTGKLTANAILTFLMYVRGRLNTVDDDLSTAWDASISQFSDVVRVELKDHSEDSELYDARRQAGRQETPMDVINEVKERIAVAEQGQAWARQLMASPSMDESGAVTFRQVLYTILSLLSGHRTGIWEGITKDEFGSRFVREDGASDITHIGGKNKTMGSTTVVLERDTDDLFVYFLSRLRPLVCLLGL